MSPGFSSITGALSRQVQKMHVPLRWNRQRYAVRPTRYGIVFLAMLTALLIGSINHNNNLGFLLTFFLAGLLIVSTMHTAANLQGISVARLPTQPVFAGGTALFGVLLKADKTKRLGITAALGHYCSEPVDLVGVQPEKVQIPVPAEKRGDLRIDSVTIGTDFPLGLLNIQVTRPLSLSCLVYPAAVRSDFLNGGGIGDGDEYAPMHSGEGADFSELSLYRVGDDLRRAHWKSLAMGRELHTVKFEEAHTGGALFSLARVPGNQLETRLGRLCYMVLAAESRGMNYGLELDDQVITPAQGPLHRNSCLKALALYR